MRVKSPGAPATPHIFAGRQPEMAALRAALADACAGRGRLVFLAGEPGIGKTRLAAELEAVARADGARVLWGRCWEGDGAPPFWPWTQVLRNDFGLAVPPLLRRLAESEPGEPVIGAGPDTRFELFDGVAEFLKRATVSQPLVVIIDDLHRGDEASLRLLQFLARGLSAARFLLLGTYRDTEVGRDHPLRRSLAEIASESARIPLRGLSGGEVRQLIEWTVGHVPSAGLVAEVYKHTEGNPFFVTEVVRLLELEGRLGQPDERGRVRLGIPVGVKAVIRHWRELVSHECQRLLALASVIGREFDLAVLGQAGAEASRLESLLGLLDEAAAAGLVIAPDEVGRCRFSHALIRETLYEDIPAADRAALHRGIGEAIEAVYSADLTPHVAALAHHFSHAIPAGTVEKAARYAVRAGDRAAVLCAHEDAVAEYERALRALALHRDLGPDELAQQRGEVLRKLGEAQARAGEADRARTSLLEAVALARARGSAEQLARAALGFTVLAEINPNFDIELAGLAEEALAGLSAENSGLRARLLGSLASLECYAGNAARGSARCREAVEVAERLGDPAVLVNVLTDAQLALVGSNDVEERLRLADRALALARRVGLREKALDAHFYRAIGLLQRADIGAVERELRACGAQARKLRRPFYLWRAAVLQAMRALLRGSFDEAEALIQGALAAGQRAHSLNAMLASATQLFGLRRDQGRLGELEAAVRWAADEYPAIPGLHAALALLYAELGREAEARAEFERCAANDFAALPRDANWLNVLDKLAQVCVFLQDVPRAGRLYELLLPYAEHAVVVAFGDACDGAAARSLGLLAATMQRLDAAARHFEDALRINAQLGARPFLARTQHQYAEMLLRATEVEAHPPSGKGGQGGIFVSTASRTQILALLNDAIATYEQLGMAGYLPQAIALREQTLRLPGAAPNAFRFDGKRWTVRWHGEPVRLRKAPALHYLAHLLRNPGRWVPTLDLERAVVPAEAIGGRWTRRDGASCLAAEDLHVLPLGDGEPAADARAMRESRARLRELQRDREDASRLNDAAWIARIDAECAVIERQLRQRRVGSEVEKLRRRISSAIHRSVRSIARRHPALGAHLQEAIGRSQHRAWRYNPRDPIEWEL